jgi:uncharacterized protein (DUF305 family)
MPLTLPLQQGAETDGEDRNELEDDDDDAMDHGGHGSMEMSDDLPVDAAFIDSMIVHHQGAVVMAEELLANTERPELIDMANVIIATQSAEIEQMRGWRAEWFAELAESRGMEMEMGAMEVSDDENVPYEQRFLDAMIDHHEGAIAMAESVLESSERPEIRTMAEAIIAAQEGEIEQMRGWLQEWFGE